MVEQPLELDPSPKQMPVLSVVGLVAVALSLLLFGVTQWQNSKALTKIEQVQQAQVELAAARAPQTRIALCNGLRVAVAVIEPVGESQKRAIAVLKQNIHVLDCPAGIERLPDAPHGLP
jgi:hypothetical protein